MRRSTPITVLAFAALVLTASASVAAPAKPAARVPVVPRTAASDTAIFAGGCFWCMQTQFEHLPGVTAVIAGYTGGTTPHPTYEQVCSHTTGHLEAVQVAFDPSVVSYDKLVERFWYSIDPTQADGQFADVGESYQTAIFARNAAQKRAALASRDALARSGRLHGRIATTIRDARPFWPAEDYHQDYWRKNPGNYRAYRTGSGRDQRLSRVWGKDAAKPLVH